MPSEPAERIVNGYLEELITCISNGDTTTAEEIIDLILQLDPDNTQALHYRKTLRPTEPTSEFTQKKTAGGLSSPTTSLVSPQIDDLLDLLTKFLQNPRELAGSDPVIDAFVNSKYDEYIFNRLGTDEDYGDWRWRAGVQDRARDDAALFWAKKTFDQYEFVVDEDFEPLNLGQLHRKLEELNSTNTKTGLIHTIRMRKSNTNRSNWSRTRRFGFGNPTLTRKQRLTIPFIGLIVWPWFGLLLAIPGWLLSSLFFSTNIYAIPFALAFIILLEWQWSTKGELLHFPGDGGGGYDYFIEYSAVDKSDDIYDELALQEKDDHRSAEIVLLATVRIFGLVLGTLCLGLGFLWMLVDKDRTTLYDKLARCRLVRPSRSPWNFYI